MSYEKNFGKAKELKPGKYVIIDGIPCKVVSIDVSKPGKHGSAKMRVVAMGIFENVKKTLLVPTDAEIEIPIIRRKNAQVVTITGDTAQVMDKETFEMYDVLIPDEFKSDIEEGKDVEILESMGKRMIVRIFKGE